MLARSENARVPSGAVCKRYGITRRTLGRWMVDEKLGFPIPLAINNRFYFDQAEIDAFDKECARKQAAARKVA